MNKINPTALKLLLIRPSWSFVSNRFKFLSAAIYCHDSCISNASERLQHVQLLLLGLHSETHPRVAGNRDNDVLKIVRAGFHLEDKNTRLVCGVDQSRLLLLGWV